MRNRPQDRPNAHLIFAAALMGAQIAPPASTDAQPAEAGQKDSFVGEAYEDLGIPKLGTPDSLPDLDETEMLPLDRSPKGLGGKRFGDRLLAVLRDEEDDQEVEARALFEAKPFVLDEPSPPIAHGMNMDPAPLRRPRNRE
jgi:hypothetical protein